MSRELDARLRTELKIGCQRMRGLLAEYREAGEGDRPYILGCAEWLAEAELTLSETGPEPVASPQQDSQDELRAIIAKHRDQKWGQDGIPLDYGTRLELNLFCDELGTVLAKPQTGHGEERK